MVERRRFRRRKRSEETPEDPPILPLERREERLARRRADRDAEEARAAAQVRVRRQAEEAEREQAERERAAQEQAEREQAEMEAARRELASLRPTAPAASAEQLAPAQTVPPAAEAPARPPRRAVTRRPAPQATLLWDQLPVFEIDSDHLERNRIITANREDPAHAAFDVLRTRLTQALAENGWTRVGITSPSKGCGKTFTAANLAISLSRQEGLRAMLMDLDLRNPSLHKAMGVRAPGCMGALLRGAISPEAHLMRMGENHIHAGHDIAFGFNEVIEPYAAELLNAPATAEVLTSIEARLQPDVMLFDLPPALYYDDVLAFRPQIDGVLLVVGGGITTEREIREVERRLGTSTPLLGMVLNKAEGTELKKYQY
ncbi:exopolysaccharide biosynthesis protein [Salipiger sp. CCB-MM3]|uniref:CpsD/CapB family tyrosine-protein kinase n=1 Tax=Salipiger sp. CCB-MM3 TaxID=1792508 RepID=UPI00080AAE7B|nr:CpsD/CapB family tyrosine-protein kinase [Salipiger sp. CCB-MM3]ANT60174.1 exopolysaccharide biosynthesis protein [Salipiger sp. CCB-MM3]